MSWWCFLQRERGDCDGDGNTASTRCTDGRTAKRQRESEPSVRPISVAENDVMSAGRYAGVRQLRQVTAATATNRSHTPIWWDRPARRTSLRIRRNSTVPIRSALDAADLSPPVRVVARCSRSRRRHRACPRDAVAQRAAIPTPESVFGFPIGKDSNLVDYEQSIDYFKKLAAASNRIHLINVGTTSFGRPWTAAIITSPENYAKLDHYRQINMRIAHPEGLTDSAAHSLARRARSSSTSAAACTRARSRARSTRRSSRTSCCRKANDPAMKEIFDNVIFFLWPTINPDGQDIVVKNCRETMFGRPPLNNEPYEKYMGHDNNRDSYMMNGIDSRVRQRVWREWEPDIIYVHHQSSPFPTRIWIPPFADPVGLARAGDSGARDQHDRHAHRAGARRERPARRDAHARDVRRVLSRATSTTCRSTRTFRPGGPRRRAAAARRRARRRSPICRRDYKDTRPTALYLSPWLEGKWSLRDAVNIMVTASIATLRYGAKFREDILYNRYQSGRDVIKKYSTAGPFAYIIPQEQRDPVAPVELLRRFAFHGIRISQLDRDVAYNGTTYPKGTWVIPMNQEFASLVQEVFEVQHYPEGADDNPYDAAGWTLPFQMGVNVIEAATPLSPEFRAALKPVPPGKAVDWHTAPDAPFTTNATAAGIVPRAGRIHRNGRSGAARSGAEQLVHAAGARARRGRQGERSSRRERPESIRRSPASRRPSSTRGPRSCGSPVSARPARRAPRSPARRRASDSATTDWTEWLFDTHDVKYTKVTNADLQAGNLASRFDVLVLPTASAAVRSWRRWWRRWWRAADAADAVVVRAPAGRTTRRARSTNSCKSGGTVLAWGNGAVEHRAGAAASGAEHDGRTLAKGVLHRHVDHAGVDRRRASGDGRHAGARRRHRESAAGVHDDRRVRRDGAREVSRPTRRRFAPASSRRAATSSCRASRRRST